MDASPSWLSRITGGRSGRLQYALFGVFGFLLKVNLDRLIALRFFHRAWNVFSYFEPLRGASGITTVSRSDAQFLLTLVAMALPFIACGVIMTLRRLRDAGLPAVWVGAFFLPIVNLGFLLYLCVVPTRAGETASSARKPRSKMLDRLLPSGRAGVVVATSIAVSALHALGVAALAASSLGVYGWGLFVALPFCQGMGAALMLGYREPKRAEACLTVAALSVLLTGLLMLLAAFEGAVCLLMALPLALALALFGAYIGYLIQRRPGFSAASRGVTMGLLLLPLALTGIERSAAPHAPIYSVRTAVEVNAPPNLVWRQVISFPELPPPREMLFRLGIAYPIRASIAGTGAGAIRRCEFSTGAFIEPIRVWDEPRELTFGVTSNPAPLNELSPYRDLRPPHLSGFLLSRGGQFLLTPLPGGRARLEGVTWYQNRMMPAGYWRLWSDAIIHRIHQRVLDHVKELAENGGS